MLIIEKKKGTLIFGKEPTQLLEDTRLIAEKEFAIKFSKQQKKFCLNFHCNGVNSFYLLLVVKYRNSKQKVLR